MKCHNFKIQAQENNKVRLFEEMTKAFSESQIFAYSSTYELPINLSEVDLGTIQILRQHVFGFFRPTHLRQHK
jgi:hypothetical protein